jgi:hypothetical protein
LKAQIATANEQNLKSQFVRSSVISQSAMPKSTHGGRRSLPFVFTEQGVAMLSGVLRSETAINVSIQIINAFVTMRRFLASNALLFQRVDKTERKLLEHDNKFEQVFNLIQDKGLKPEKGIFFDGQIFDSYKFVSDLVRSANKSIVLVDNYIDESVLILFSKRKKGVQVAIHTKINEQVSLDIKKFDAQYDPIEINEFNQAHDRFMIIDDEEVYHFGASLKDLGKKWFAFPNLIKKH